MIRLVWKLEVVFYIMMHLTDEVFIDELYADLKYSWIQVIAGRKQEPELYNGLSASNENILWSINSRPLYGLQIQTNRPGLFLFQ